MGEVKTSPFLFVPGASKLDENRGFLLGDLVQILHQGAFCLMHAKSLPGKHL